MSVPGVGRVRHAACYSRGMPAHSNTRQGNRSKKPASRKRYGDKASEKVERALHEMKRGELRSGGSGARVTNPKQAIAIGLSEARRAGGKVPAAPRAKKASAKRKTAAKNAPSRKKAA
jgi:hypothetical protein